MKRVLVAIAMAVAAACGSQSSFTPDVTRSALTASSTGRYLVVFKSETLPAGAAAAVTAAGGKVDRAIARIGVMSVSAGAGFKEAMAKNSSVLAVGQERLHAAPEVTAAEVSAADVNAGPTLTDDLYNRYGWDMRRIHAPAVWAALPLATARTATVAVLDVGVMETHPDLAGQVVSSKSTAYCSTSGGANNSAGYPIYSTLIDFDAHPEWSPEMGCTAAATTYEWHGTHVAGTIAAKFGGGRAVGVDPDARVAVYKVFDRYRYTDDKGVLHDRVGGFDGAIFDAIIDAAANHIPVVSMSLGSNGVRSNKDDNASWLSWNRIARFANQAGVVVVAAAGNEELNLNGKTFNLPSDIPTILSVSASNISQLTLVNGQWVPAAGATDTLASYSNYGAASVDVTAPGGDCSATEGCLIQYYIVSDGISGTGAPTYYGAAGTSMATPHVSAVVAMVRALHPDWDPGTVRSYIRETAQDLGDHQAFGHGMVNADVVLH